MHRRSFVTGLAAASALAAAPARLLAAAAPKKIALGYDNFAVRAMQWKAPALIDYAAKLKCDTLLISDLDAYESLDDAALRAVRAKAEAVGVQLYAGSWSICPTSKAFRPNRGTAEEHLRLGLRVSKALGSPVFRVVLGNMEDRKTEGGIRARIADTVAVLKACRTDAKAAGVKIAIENHAGDMHSWELRDLIKAAGEDFVGANIDSGNAAWTLEDPMDVLETLGPVTICSSLRDDMIWETPDGAAVQWTAAGDGLIDWKKYAARWAQTDHDQALLRQWKFAAQTQVCPSPHCHFTIEKNSGCNHVSCRCGHHFCWVCGEEWSQKHSYFCRKNNTNINNRVASSEDTTAAAADPTSWWTRWLA